MSTEKMISITCNKLMLTGNKKWQFRLSKFIYEAKLIRKNIISGMSVL